VRSSFESPSLQVDTSPTQPSNLTKAFMVFRAGSHGVPCPESQVPLILASPNMEALSQLLSLKKPLNYGYLTLKSDFDYFMENIRGTCVESWV
jgi:hypothetical protein